MLRKFSPVQDAMKASYKPDLSLIDINLKSPDIQRLILLIKDIGKLYLRFFGAFVLLVVIGELFPGVWDSLNALLNSMSFEFSLRRASSPLGYSISFAVASLFISALMWREFLRWQFMLTFLMGICLLSLAYLGCAFVLLVSDTWYWHAVIIGVGGLVFILVFFTNSLIRFYWSYQSYGDVIIEVLMGAGFSLFMLQMFVMAWRSAYS
jgi:hypothetical protein